MADADQNTVNADGHIDKSTAEGLAIQLKYHKDQIIEHWCQRVSNDREMGQANQLSKAELIDHIPGLFDAIISELSEGDHDGHLPNENTTAQHLISRTHAQARMQQGYGLPEALRELAHLRAAVLESKLPFDLPEQAMLLFHSRVDHAMALVAEEIAQNYVSEQQARKSADERLRLILENVQDYGMFTMDRQGVITEWNQGAQKITGYESSAIIGQKGHVLFVPEDQQKRVPEYELSMAEKNGRAEDTRWHMRSDGKRFWANGSTTALKDDLGHLCGFIKIFRDDTESKQIHEERERLLEETRIAKDCAENLAKNLEDTSAELRRLDKMKDVFLATLSHELRTPLGVIVGYVDLLQDGISQNDPGLYAEALSAIERNVNIQRQIVSDLLDVSKIIAGKLSLDLRPVSLPPIIEAALAMVRLEAKTKRIQIKFTPNSYVGPILGDPGRIQQIIWNLLTNAIKFTPDGGNILIVLQPSRNGVEIVVKDSGRGIHASLLPYVFDHFRQAEDPINRRHGGLGLGLALVRQLTELHGGTVTVKSAGENQGATFTINLPTAGVWSAGDNHGKM